jgi:hypothetical protein
MARRGVLLGALAMFALATPLTAQTEDWQYRWYWGAKGGALGYTLPTGGVSFTGQAGGEWLITARRTGLYIGYSQSFQTEVDTFQVQGTTGTTQVSFDGFRRIQIAIVALIGNSTFQPYVGGGFALHTLTNSAPPAGSSTALGNAVADASSIGIAMVMGGVQYRTGRKLAFYFHWQGSPGSRDFLLSGATNSFEFGVRYAFLPARGDDPTTRR